ncbi:uncharacterized protein LOC116031675 [Ipomoea triloba]|uniref:uncharacterized protein LOC116031675 n=1 Tax=Ipomoea triloba TaxID=35885 RepID=UPI00125D4EA8|nr:uncharacterized protein LOC116031675 [Ipomoea triloba]
MESWEDDNILFEELTRQLLELTEEDDNKRIVNSKHGNRYRPSILQPQCRFEWIHSEDTNNKVPKYLVELWNREKSNNGTGVFIPKRSTNKGKGSIKENMLHPQCLVFSWISEYRGWVFIGTGASVPISLTLPEQITRKEEP